MTLAGCCVWPHEAGREITDTSTCLSQVKKNFSKEVTLITHTTLHPSPCFAINNLIHHIFCGCRAQRLGWCFNILPTQVLCIEHMHMPALVFTITSTYCTLGYVLYLRFSIDQSESALVNARAGHSARLHCTVLPSSAANSVIIQWTKNGAVLNTLRYDCMCKIQWFFGTIGEFC